MIETFSDALPSKVHSLAHICMAEACERRLKIAVAESCTGGLFAAVITDVEGCAHAFDRGFVIYTDVAKREVLGVPAEILERYSAVSVQAAAAMAQGALSKSEADVALSITGYAGPGGPGEEPGLAYFGIVRRSFPPQVIMRRFEPATRTQVRISCLEVGLELLHQILTHAPMP